MNFRIALLASTMLVSAAGAETTGAAIAQAIRDTTLDADACYRVREMNFDKEDLKFYLTDGFLIFAKPVLGQRLWAVFSAEVEGGDAEVLLMPPHRSERRSLASFAGSPNLDEHFRTALLMFSDGTGEQLLRQAAESGRQTVDMGALMKDRWNSLAHNISAGFEVRLLQDVLSPDRSTGFFFAGIAGNQLGNFDVIHDPAFREQIVAGRYNTRGSTPVFDVWTSFESRSIRTGKRKPAKPIYDLGDYRIDAALDSSLHMRAVTKANLTTSAPVRAFALNVSDKVQITAVTIDGKPVELYTRESMRDAAIRGGANTTYVAFAPEPLSVGQAHEIEMRHEGDVVVPAGNEVYYVTSRGNWYPRAGGSEFATYDLTFRYPKRLTLVSTGDPVEDRVEGEMRVTRRKTAGPVRVAGFNLGQYVGVKLARGGYSIEVFGNAKLEPSLQPKPAVPAYLPPLVPRLPRQPELVQPAPPPPPKPASRLSTLAEDIASAFDFMRAEFGPPPIKSLTVSPIPGAFGQGFPGLVYLSTLAYISADERPAAVRTRSNELFFSELLPAHEIAHQWWGNLVAAGGYQDEWLMEAFPSYAALLYLEKRRGPKAVESVLESYEANLLHKMEDGRTVESTGPITWGPRLQTSQSPDAWRVITYQKGAWILHMLRRRMGDERFHKLMGELCRRYAHEPLTTEHFRKVAEEIMSPKGGGDALGDFFEGWVYSTGIPALKLSWAVKGNAPALRVTGTVSQVGVDDDFAVEVPVEISAPRGGTVTQWVRTSNDGTSFSAAVKQAPSRVVIPVGTGVLATRK